MSARRWASGPTALASVLIVAALVLAGCGGQTTGDKAGGQEPPIVLRLGNPDYQGNTGAEALEHFASAVADASAGRITIQIIWGAGEGASDFEAEVVQQVRDGRLDIGWIGARTWDEERVTAFAALQAPFLITDYAVLNEVMASDLPERMLGALDDSGFTGLGTYPDQLRHPLGFEAPFLTLADFNGAHIRVPNSLLSDEIIRSLGAVPVHLNGPPLSEALATGELQGAETSMGNAPTLTLGSYMTGNLTFYPKLFTLFAASERYDALSDTSRSALQAAAAETLDFVLGQDPEAADIAAFCQSGGKLVEASPGDVAEIAAATDPVMQQLEADATTAAYIAAIRDLKASGAAPPSPRCPS